MKTYISVPFEQKDKVKDMGARYDMACKSWYVPDGVDLVPFLSWLPNRPKLSKSVKRTLAEVAFKKTRQPPKEMRDQITKWATKK